MGQPPDVSVHRFCVWDHSIFQRAHRPLAASVPGAGQGNGAEGPIIIREDFHLSLVFSPAPLPWPLPNPGPTCRALWFSFSRQTSMILLGWGCVVSWLQDWEEGASRAQILCVQAFSQPLSLWSASQSSLSSQTLKTSEGRISPFPSSSSAGT